MRAFILTIVIATIANASLFPPHNRDYFQRRDHDFPLVGRQDDGSTPTATDDGSASSSTPPTTSDSSAPSSAASSAPAGPRQCTDPAAPSDGPSAATLYNNANAGKLILDTLASNNGGPGFPTILVQNQFAPGGQTFTFDCTNLDDASKCVAPTGPGGTICETMIPDHSDAVVLIVRSYVNMYNFLRNCKLASQTAHDLIANGNFLQKLHDDLQPGSEALAQAVLQILEIAISFIPVGGIELLAVKTAVKVFKKIADQTLKSAISDAKTKDVPPISALKTQLDAMLKTFQDAVIAQHKQIFIDGNPGTDSSNPQFVWLDQGIQLVLTISQQDLVTNIRSSFQNFMVSSFLALFGGEVVKAGQLDIERLGINCNKPQEVKNDLGNGQGSECFAFGYPKITPFEGFLERHQPAAVGTFIDNKDVWQGLNFQTIVNNARSCKDSGGDITKIDIAGFLNDPKTTVPACLFGYPIVPV